MENALELYCKVPQSKLKSYKIEHVLNQKLSLGSWRNEWLAVKNTLMFLQKPGFTAQHPQCMDHKFFWPLQTLGRHVMYIYMRHLHTKSLKKNLKNLKPHIKWVVGWLYNVIFFNVELLNLVVLENRGITLNSVVNEHVCEWFKENSILLNFFSLCGWHTVKVH